jgi:hypothetical protein
VNAPFQNSGLRTALHRYGLRVPEPHNDDVQGAPVSEQERGWRTPWPLMLIAVGLIATLAWVSFFGWLVFELADGIF